MNAVEYLQSIPESDRKAIGQCILIAYDAGHKELALKAAEHIINIARLLGEEADRVQVVINQIDEQIERLNNVDK